MRRVFKKSKYAINMDRTKKVFVHIYGEKEKNENNGGFWGGVIFTLFFTVLAIFFYSQMV